MKKLYLLLSVLAFSTMASAQYFHSAGLFVGSMEGISYKGWYTDHFAFQADVLFRMDNTTGAEVYGQTTPLSVHKNVKFNGWDFSVSPNLLYQATFAQTGRIDYNWFAGGGIGLGLAGAYYTDPSNLLGKFGINSIAGVEGMITGAPIIFSFDFRPGYGMYFRKGYTYHAFDWAFSLGVRYSW